ncbi:MAG: HAMP domain-containing histidine kinase [Deltaproteobacteria bacterium]|nr:HAMP domain-containing histidine kinase [Deltaproteobacteria bacterium]
MTKGASRRPSLRVILLAVNLVILAIPISGIYLFRVYENELVRQTESELISQATLVAAMFKREILALGGANYGQQRWLVNPFSDDDLRPVPPTLDLSKTRVEKDSLVFGVSQFPPDPLALAAANRLAPVLAEAVLTTLSTINILDYRGLNVSDERNLGLSLTDNLEISQALEGHYASLLRRREFSERFSLKSISRGARYRVFVAMPVLNGSKLLGVVHLSRTPREISKALYQERRNVAYSLALVLGLMVMVSLIAALLIISPVKTLAKEARLVADGLKSQPAPESGLIMVKEIFELRASVLEMARRLGKRSDYLKAFSSGVSHEFKTPLSSIKGALEILFDDSQEMEPEVRRRFEGNVQKDLERLEGLAKRLLALARAEAQEPTGQERVEAGALVLALARRFQDKYPDFLVTSQGAGEVWLAMTAEDLETILVNLWENSRENGATLVEVAVLAKGDRGIVEVRDNGRGLTSQEAEKIFAPFYTTRKNQGGTGLGLSLARTLLAPYRGELIWVGEPAIFRLTVPLRHNSVS